MKRRWLRWWPAWLGLMIFAAFCCLVAARAQRPDFDFLAGHEPLASGAAWTSYVSFSPPGEVTFITEYSFEAVPQEVIRQADRQLIPAGWTKTSGRYRSSSPPPPHVLFYYQEPCGLERLMLIEMAEPLGPRAVSIHVTIERPDKTLDWQEKAKRWFGKIFLGRP